MYIHQSNVRHGKSTHNNWDLFREIKSIIDVGSSVKYNKVYHTDNEIDAYDYEEKLIALYGLDNLCNIFDKHRRVYSGELHPMYGKKHTDETKEKIGKKSKGRNHTLESRMKMGLKGNKHPLYGIGHSIVTRKKMSENHADFNGQKNPFYGKIHTNDTKVKISNKLKKEYKIKFPNNKIIKFNGSDSVKYFTERYNSITHQKVSYHSIFQYGINKHGWELINE